MTHFCDASGRQWTVELDGFVLGEIRDQANLDLTRGDGWAKLEKDEIQLARLLPIICREEIEERKLKPAEFVKAVAGEAIEQAFAAVRGAAIAFFPRKRWSEIQSSWSDQQKAEIGMAALRPMLRVLADPDVPEAMTQSVMMAITEQIQAFKPTDSPPSPDPPSASGREVIRSTPASASQDSLVSPREG